MTMQIVKARPPNYEEILKVLPRAKEKGVIFAYGDTIYVPSGNELSHHLKVHEAIHGIRQQKLGVEFWWKKYLEDKAFRYHEELLAHHAEYRSMIGEGATRQERRGALKEVAKRLAMPLYGCSGGRQKAMKDLKGMDKDGKLERS